MIEVLWSALCDFVYPMHQLALWTGCIVAILHDLNSRPFHLAIVEVIEWIVFLKTATVHHDCKDKEVFVPCVLYESTHDNEMNYNVQLVVSFVGFCQHNV
jgi:hypothetical protein